MSVSNIQSHLAIEKDHYFFAFHSKAQTAAWYLPSGKEETKLVLANVLHTWARPPCTYSPLKPIYTEEKKSPTKTELH